VAGLSLPVLTVRKIWEQNTFTILSGIQNLYKDGQYFLTFVVFFFSIVFPIVKLGALNAIWFYPMAPERRERILHWLSLLGKWSMLDVFIVAVIIVSVKLGVLASANAEEGVYYFGVSILLAMWATAVESRLAGHRVSKVE
jgi:paraquat-inducible protein A